MKYVYSTTNSDDLHDERRRMETTHFDPRNPEAISRTLQDPAEETDLNVLAVRMGWTDSAKVPHFQDPNALWGDAAIAFPSDPTDAHNAMRQAQLVFDMLPAKTRRMFDGPTDMFKFMDDEKNRDEAERLGLLAKKKDTTNLVSSSTGSDKEKPVPPTTLKEGSSNAPST